MFNKFIVTGSISLVLLIWQSFDVAHHYYSAQNEQLLVNMDRMQRLQIFSRTTIAKYADTTIRTHKTGDVYSYNINGNNYSFSIETLNVPPKNNFEVSYLPDDPTVHSIDPGEQLAVYKQQLMYREKIPASTWVLILLAFGGLIYSIIKLKMLPDRA
jgi:hypothetical protein